MQLPRPLRSYLLAVLLTCASPWLAQATDFTPEPGYISLYNGKDLTGWTYKTGAPFDGKAESSDNRYSAQADTLIVHPGTELAQLWTTREFPKNFTLKLEFRASINADSGVFLRKPQLQCRDYLVAGPYTTLTAYKPQDWNLLEIIVKDGIAHCTCNGELLEDALPIPATGPIGLEADRGQMEYRHIQLKE